MEFKDYYATLGLTKTASAKEVKQAFRKLARKFHPDVNPGDHGAEAKFKEINEAYEVLADPDKRKKYDELGANWRAYEQGGAGFDPSMWTAPRGGAGGGFRTMTEDEMREMFGDSDPFSDFFHTFFGGVGGGSARGHGSGRARANRQGRDVEYEVTLSLEEALHGTTRRLTISHNGQERTVDVRIPSGITDGSRVRISGEGEHGAGSGRSGDLYLRIRLAPHARFERKGRDLHLRAHIPLTTAVLGGEVDITTLTGRSLRLKVPAGTQNGQVLRIKGHGLPSTGKSQELGDLYATVDVQVPRELSPEQRQHFEALRKLEGGTRHSAA